MNDTKKVPADSKSEAGSEYTYTATMAFKERDHSDLSDMRRSDYVPTYHYMLYLESNHSEDLIEVRLMFGTAQAGREWCLHNNIDTSFITHEDWETEL